MQREHIDLGFVGPIAAVCVRVFEGELPYASASLCGLPRARVIDEDAPYELSGNPEELGTVLPLDALLINEAKVGLVDERRCLERVPRVLVLQCAGCLAMELAVNDGYQRVERCPVPSAPCQEKVGDACRRREG